MLRQFLAGLGFGLVAAATLGFLMAASALAGQLRRRVNWAVGAFLILFACKMVPEPSWA